MAKSVFNSERSASCDRLQYQMRYPLLCEYATRLSTFGNWRYYLDPESLAENGFFRQGVGDTVICHFCGVSLMHFKPDDDILLEHLRYSPSCGYLMKALDVKNIQQYLDQRNDGVTTEASNIAKSETQSSRPSAEVCIQNSRTPRSPSYQTLGVRVSTFSTFPNSNDINIQDLANAGFYYTGVNDMVRCYWCDLCLIEWEFGDDPYFEHAKYLPECNHLMTVKGKHFITLVQRAYVQKLEEGKVSSSPIEISGAAGGAEERNHMRHNVVNASTLHMGPGTEKQRNMIGVLDTPAVKSVLEHGYSKEAVMAAIRKLTSKGQSFPTTMQILDVIFHAEENGMDLITKDLVRLDIQKAEVVRGSEDDEKKENIRIGSTLPIYGQDLPLSNGTMTQMQVETQKLQRRLSCRICKQNHVRCALDCGHLTCEQCSERVIVCPLCGIFISKRYHICLFP